MKMKKKIIPYVLLITLLLVSVNVFNFLPKGILGGTEGGSISADDGGEEKSHPTEFTIEPVDSPFSLADGSALPQSGIDAWKGFQMHFTCKIPNGLKKGDQTVITLGNNVKIPTPLPFDMFDVKSSGAVVANVKTTEKTLTLTYTDYVENRANLNISGEIKLVVGIDSNIAEVNDHLPIDVLVDGRTTLIGTLKYTGIPKTDAKLIRKYGKNYFDTSTFLYTIRVNETRSSDRKAWNLGKTYIIDKLKTQGAQVHEDGFTVRRVKYGVDKSGNDVTVVDWGELLPKDKYKLVIDSDKQGFRFDFVDSITEDDQFFIEYRVKLTPPFLLRNGEKALNTATIYTENNIGGGGPAYSTAEVVYNLSNASAGGYAYKLHLRKVDKANPDKGLSGAKFKFTDRNKQWEIYTTDSEGYIKLENVLNATYTVEEVEAPAGYQLDKTKRYVVPSPASGIVPILKVENVAESAQVIPKREIKVQKIWGDRSDKNPEGVTLQLMLDGEVKGSVKFEKNETTQSHTFTVDKSDVSGKELNYTIREINDANQPIPEGGEITLGGKNYKVSYSGNMETGFVVTNTDQSKIIKVKKVWSGNPGTNPATSILKLLLNGEVKGEVTFQEGEAAMEHTFYHLDNRAADGSPIPYKIYEVGEENNEFISSHKKIYDVEYSGDAITGFVVTNKERNIPSGKRYIQVKKIWASGSDTNEEDTTINLLAGNKVVNSIKFEKGQKKNQHFFIEDIKDTSGNIISYEVHEVGEKDGIVKLGEKLYEAKMYSMRDDRYKDTPNYWEVRNTEIPTISIDVEKQWKKSDNSQASPSVGKVKVQLYRNEKAYEAPIELTESNGWKYKFSDLFKFEPTETSKIGIEPYVYTIKELDEKDKPIEEGKDISFNGKVYTTSYKGTPETGFVVTNTEKPLPPSNAIDVTVKKTWGEGSEKQDVTLNLMMGNEVVDRVEFKKDATVLQHTFKVSPTDKSGKDAVYTVKEVGEKDEEISLNGKIYKVAYSGDMKTGLEVINVEKTISTMDLTVKKQWSKSDGTVLELPPVEKVKFKLYRDGVEQDTKELSKDNNWSYQFLLLPVSDKISGKPYVYTVKELDSNDKLLEKKEEFTLGSRKFVVDYPDFNSTDKSLVIQNQIKKTTVPGIFLPESNPQPNPNPSPTPDLNPNPSPLPTPDSQPSPEPTPIIPPPLPPVVTEEIEDIPIEPIPAGDIEIPTLEEEDIPEEVEQSEDDEELIGIEEDEVPQGSKDMKPKYKKVLAKTGGLEVRFISYSFFFMLAIVLFVGINRYKKKSR